MARVEAVVICLLIIIMDALAGVLGIQAEKAQNQGGHLKILFFECRQPVQKAYRLGVAAAAVLAASHVIANIVGGCTCTCSGDQLRQSSPNRQMASLALVLSWVVLVVGFAMLLIGALPNSKPRAACGLVHHHFLSIGGILCFVHCVFCLVYYVSANAAAREERRGAIGVNM